MACLSHHTVVTGTAPLQQPTGCSAVKCFSSGMRAIHLPFMSPSFMMAEMFIQEGLEIMRKVSLLLVTRGYSQDFRFAH